MKRVLVLGSGLVGRAIAVDLSGDFEVHAADADQQTLESVSSAHAVTPIHADLSNPRELTALVQDFDIVVNALPGHMGYEALKNVISAGKNVVDIAFSPEDPLELDSEAKEKGVTAVVDCGVAPGLCNMILGYEWSRLKDIHAYSCIVGGLPVEREWPWEYKAVFSPIDVIEEYTRPCRLVENGTLVVKPALSGVERIDFKGIGTLEAFNTDGLRTLLKTMKIPDMKEKTLRYPGHVQLMEVMRETGFFRTDPINIHGTEIRPLDVTAAILFPKWKMRRDEADFTVMRVEIDGSLNGKNIRRVYDLFDQFDWNSRTTSMARTTGYTCTAMVRLLAEGKITETGVIPPEKVGMIPGAFPRIRELLEARGVRLSTDG